MSLDSGLQKRVAWAAKEDLNELTTSNDIWKPGVLVEFLQIGRDLIHKYYLAE